MEQSYKEKYEQALAKAKEQYNYPCMRSCMGILEEIFPELKESWDEKMRKAIKEALSSKQAEDIIESKYKIKMVDVSDWLEKQGQVKESTISQHEIETCKENDDSLTSENEKVRKEIINYFRCQSEEEPIRKEIHNKWIAWLENIPYTIDHEKREGFHLGYKACLEKQGEKLPAGFYYVNSEGKKFYSDTFKYGDVILHVEKQGEQKSQRTISAEAKEALFDYENANMKQKDFAPNDEQKPADSYCQENCKGYQETGKCFADGSCKAKREAEQKTNEISIWSEEDSQYVEDTIALIGFGHSAHTIGQVQEWLQSLKGRVQPQPKQEWSEEDEKIINGLIDSLTRISLNTRTDSTSPNFSFYKEIDWLKSLRPQNHWKPSELQLGCLSDAIGYYNSLGYPAPKLKELLDDLKELKEGKV